MKALQYLQRVGAVPDYEKWDLLMALVTITHEFFTPDMIVEPDIIGWTQEAESQEEFERRCDAILFATSGDVRAMFPHVCNEPESFLIDLIQILLEIRISYFAFAECPDEEPGTESWFVDNYNDFLDLKGKKRFPTKASILHFFYSGSLVESGQETMAEIAGTEVDFISKVSEIQAEFIKFASQEGGVTVGETKLDGNCTNPFEGGYQVRVFLKVPGEEKEQECTLHWAPWPSAKTHSNVQEVLKICENFSDKYRDKWFQSLIGEG